jgi:hypothetical protein
VTFTEAGGEDEDFFHGSLGQRDGRSGASLMDIYARQSKLWLA